MRKHINNNLKKKKRKCYEINAYNTRRLNIDLIVSLRSNHCNKMFATDSIIRFS